MLQHQIILADNLTGAADAWAAWRRSSCGALAGVIDCAVAIDIESRHVSAAPANQWVSRAMAAASQPGARIYIPCVALQCGGSDSYSDITANPAFGYAADRLVEHGGTAILSETPDIYGAEHLLTRCAAIPEVAEKLRARIR